ncbi:hypothetical protein ACIQCJ_26555 [Streptomyces sp. NPDC093221]|uniref:hypothetical protein n=1 Tax=unclassified Streptomyces TaxID=2593676 RepID=UPI003451C83A
MGHDLIAKYSSTGGIAPVGILVMVALLAGFVWDARRFPDGPLLRWLLPVGLIPFMVGALLNILALIIGGAVVMGVGFWASRISRSKKRDGQLWK